MTIKLAGAGTDGLEFSGSLITAFPFTLVIYIASPKSNSINAAITLGSTTKNSYAHASFDWGNEKRAGYTSPTVGGMVATKNTAPDINNTTLVPLVAVFTSNNSRTIYFGSNVGVTDTGSNTNVLADMDRLGIGCLRANGTLTWNMAGQVAEAHLFAGVAFTSSDVQTLVNAVTLPETMTGWLDGWPLKDHQPSGNYPSITGTRTLVALGGVSAGTLPHPISRTTAGPNITTQPSNATVTTPATATFTVAASATGGGTLSYQWQRSTNSGGSWANVSAGSGGTSTAYTTPATTVTGGNANNADQFRCVVTETGGTNAGAVNSSAAILTVNAAATGPTINTQPSNATVTSPATATFTVVATTSGGALSYQWQRNGSNIGSANAASYTTPATTVTGGSANSGDLYRCVVTDSNGSTTSSAATLTVNPAPGTLNFQAAGMEFGRRTGLAVSTFALDTASNYRYTVHADALVLGSAIYTSAAVATDSNGKLPNISNAAFATGTTYRVVAVRQADGEAATFRMVAA